MLIFGFAGAGLGLAQRRWHFVFWIVVAVAVVLLTVKGVRRFIDWRRDLKWEREARGSP
ncbi:MAG TPA: hypothetical protein VK215_04335 [Acidimicrobiales bacterium]|nr:hypothetical protein [Acidimicrobiales bacterium]